MHNYYVGIYFHVIDVVVIVDVVVVVVVVVVDAATFAPVVVNVVDAATFVVAATLDFAVRYGGCT